MMELSFVALDVETANADQSSICQIGIVVVEDGEITRTFESLVDPETYFDEWNVEIHGITRSMVRGKPRFSGLAATLHDLIGSRVVASHTPFDRIACERAYEKYDLVVPQWRWLDTARVARRAWKQFASRGYGLANIASHCGIEFRHHSAAEDARAAAQVLMRAAEETGLDVADWLARVRRPIEPISRDGSPDGPLAGQVVVFTGALSIPRSQAATRAAALGCNVRNGVTSSTTLLVIGQQDLRKLNGYTKSSKQRKAEQLIRDGTEIAILGEEDFLRMEQAATT